MNSYLVTIKFLNTATNVQHKLRILINNSPSPVIALGTATNEFKSRFSPAQVNAPSYKIERLCDLNQLLEIK